MNMNDRALRDIVVSLGGPLNGFPRQDGFDIVVASEVMAIFCLAQSMDDLKTRLGNIVVGYTTEQKPVCARDLQAHGAMTVLLQKAMAPNLVQTLEHTPALIHGGPFANIAHGCNSVIATRAALKLADYVVTEAGFGADLGAEKFVNIKCRKSGLRPSASVVVATVRALKYQGGAALPSISQESLPALEKGLVNLERHVDNVQRVYGIPCVVAINHFTSDTPAEIAMIKDRMQALGVQVVLTTHWADGGFGAEELANIVVDLCAQASDLQFVYSDSDTLWQKVTQLAHAVYRAASVTASAKVRAQIEKLQADGYGHYPVCIAKTPYSFSTDAKLLGAPQGHTLDIREVRLAAGAEFVVMVCGDIMTMPGLPKQPAANRIDLVDGKIVGLF
jgi:formate--tetrahydrofolate ligase